MHIVCPAGLGLVVVKTENVIGWHRKEFRASLPDLGRVRARVSVQQTWVRIADAATESGTSSDSNWRAIVIAQEFPNAPIPVSYTHLDVYKRQRLIWAFNAAMTRRGQMRFVNLSSMGFLGRN